MAGNINALIAQGIRPPQVPSPQEAQTQALTLANAMQEQKIQQQQLAQGQQQLQSGQLDLQQKQYQLAQQKAINSIYQQAFTPTPPPASAGAAGAPGGASPPAGTAPAQAPGGASPPAGAAPGGASPPPGAAPAQAPGGALPIDMDKLQSGLAQAGFGSAVGSAVMKGFQEYQKTGLDLEKAKQELRAAEGDHAGAYGAAIRQSGYDPNLFVTSLQREINAGNVAADQIQPLVKQIAQAMQQDPTGQAAKQLTQKFTDQLIAASPKQRELDTAAQTAQARQQQAETSAAEFQAKKPGLEADAAIAQNKLKMIQNAKPEDYIGLVDQIVPPSVPQNAALNQRTKAQVQFALQQGNIAGAQQALAGASAEVRQLEIATDPRVQQNKISLAIQTQQGKNDANIAASGLTPDAFAAMGEQYARTGVMPALGRDSVTRSKIAAAANQWRTDNGLSPSDLVTMQAAYAGDKKSLEKFQGQRDQIVSFEQTAQKNLDQFLSLAQSIPDTGVPWANTPLRLLDAKLVGTPNMAAIGAARQVANNEIAKVTSGGGLSGVISDSARHEVEGYNPQNATFAQTLAVARVLKQDMANRHASMDATLGDIKARIGGTPATAAGAPRKIGTRAEFDALPSGTTYTDPADGKTYRKP